MVAEIIAEMVTLYVIKPFLEDIFGSIFWKKKAGRRDYNANRINVWFRIIRIRKWRSSSYRSPFNSRRAWSRIVYSKTVWDYSTKPQTRFGGTSNYVYAPNIKTGASADEVFAILDKHSRKFFAMIQDGIENNSGLRNAVRVGS